MSNSDAALATEANKPIKTNKRSLAVRLLKIVFSIYLSITILITGVQMYNAYQLEKKAIENNLKSYEQIFGLGIATALWNIDDEQLYATLEGITHLNDIAGVWLQDAKGIDLFKKGAVHKAGASELATSSQGRSGKLFYHTFPVNYQNRFIGTAHFYSSNDIVFNNVKYNFIAILINALIKTAVLWLLFIWAFNRFLGKALEGFTEKVEKLDFESSSHEDIIIDTFAAPELERLEQVISQLGKRIVHSKSALQELNKELEQKVEERTQQINRQKSMLESMSQQGRIGAWEFNLAQQKLYWSKITKVIHEVPEDFQADVATAIEFYKQGYSRELIQHAFDQAITHGTPWNLELQIVTAKGKELWVAAAGQAEFIDGKCVRLFGSFQDIDSRIKTQNDLILAKNNADAANHAKSTFLASMSHEIRTPMNGIIGMLNLLLKNNLNDSQRQQAELSLTSAKNLMTLLNDILDISKIEAGKLAIENIDIDIEALFRESSDILRNEVEQKGLLFELRFERLDTPVLMGDPSRIRQIIYNLTSNAIKFTSKGTVKLNIGVTHQEHDKYLLTCEVSDTGIGIDAEKQQSVFELFTQVDASTTRQYGGTGLGLTIAKQLSELMGGQISLESEVNKGSTFSFSVTLTKGESLPSYQIASPQESKNIARSADNCAILIVEDNKVNQLVAQSMLTQMGYKSEVVENGLACIEKLKGHSPAQPYALLLMDCQMPVMDGYEASEKLRSGAAGEIYQHIPIIAMTANAMSGDEERCIASGMNDYISKPVDPVKLQEIISKWIDSEAD